jgi:transposase
VHFAGVSVTKRATLLGLSRAAVSKVMMPYTNHGWTSSAKRNGGRKPKLSERDHHTLKRIVSIHHRSTAAKVTVELNIHLTTASEIQYPW